MATQLANAQAILDALADARGKSLTNQQKLNIVEEFLSDVGGPGTNEEKAAAFNYNLAQIIVKIGKKNVEHTAIQANQAAVTAAVDNSSSGALENVVAPAPLPEAAPVPLVEEEVEAPVKKGWWARFLEWDRIP